MRRIIVAALIACAAAALLIHFFVSEQRPAKTYTWEVSVIGTDANSQEPVSDVSLRTASTEYYVGELTGQCHTIEGRGLLANELSGLLCNSSVGSVEIGVFRSETGTSLLSLDRLGPNGAARDLFSSRVILVLNPNDWEE